MQQRVEPTPPDEVHSLRSSPRVRSALAGGALLLTPVVAFFAHNLILADRIPICPFRVVTGKPCPLCGLTRAFAHASHGDWALAQSSHPLWSIAFAAVVTLGLALIIDGMFETRLSSLWRTLTRPLRLPLLLGLIAFGLWRLIA